jgi:hypothetical protein
MEAFMCNIEKPSRHWPGGKTRNSSVGIVGVLVEIRATYFLDTSHEHVLWVII